MVTSPQGGIPDRKDIIFKVYTFHRRKLAGYLEPGAEAKGSSQFCPGLIIFSGANIIWYYMMLYDIIWYYMILYDIIWYYMILYDIIWYYIWCYILRAIFGTSRCWLLLFWESSEIFKWMNLLPGYHELLQMGMARIQQKVSSLGRVMSWC